MEIQHKSSKPGWGDCFDLLDFVPDEFSVTLLACVAAGFVLWGIIWAASRVWENIAGG